MHIISSYRKLNYILFTERLISTSQLNTINPYTQINKICPYLKYTQYFSEKLTISYFQMYKLDSLHRNTLMFFSEKHTTFSSPKCT